VKIDGRWRLAGEEDEPEPERIEPEPEDLSRWVIAVGAKARSSTARGTDSGQRSVWAVEKLWTTLCTILWAKVRRYADGRTKHILRKGPPRKGGPERNAPRSRREAAKWIRQVKSASKFPRSLRPPPRSCGLKSSTRASATTVWVARPDTIRRPHSQRLEL
jgi:hypothetical protein